MQIVAVAAAEIVMWKNSDLTVKVGLNKVDYLDHQEEIKLNCKSRHGKLILFYYFSIEKVLI